MRLSGVAVPGRIGWCSWSGLEENLLGQTIQVRIEKVSPWAMQVRSKALWSESRHPWRPILSG
jgi:hypothetical protein